MAKKEGNGGCLSSVFLIIIIIVMLGGCNACMNRNSNDNDSAPKTHKVVKKKQAKKNTKQQKEKSFKIKDSQKSINSDLESNSTLKKYVSKIIYQGNGEAEIKVSGEFPILSESKKSSVAEKINDLVTSDIEDTGVDADPYSFLTFTYQGRLLGNSKQSSHNEYKWR